MPTVRQLLTDALTLAGIYQEGEVPSANDMNAAKRALVFLNDSWSNDDLLVYTTTEFVFPIIAGQATYSWGVGGDWASDRPMEIVSMKSRTNPGSLAQLDLPITPLTADQWAANVVKETTSTLPLSYYDDRAYPTRNIRLWPVPQENMVVAIWAYQPLMRLDALDEEVKFPPGYERAFNYALAQEICPIFGRNVPTTISDIAAAAVAKIKEKNAVTPTFQFDSGLNRNRIQSVPYWYTKAGGFLF